MKLAKGKVSFLIILAAFQTSGGADTWVPVSNFSFNHYLRSQTREFNHKGRPLSGSAFNRNVALMALYDSVDGRKTEAYPITFFFGGVKWFEDLRKILMGNPSARVFHDDNHLIPITIMAAI